MRIVYDYLAEPIKARVDELVADDPTIDAGIAFNTILDAVEAGAVTLDQLPDLTLRPKDQGGE